MVEEYDQTIEPLKEQLDNVYRSFLDNKKVQELYRQRVSKYKHSNSSSHSKSSTLKKKDQRKLFKISVLQSISPMEILEPKWYPSIGCYSDHDEAYHGQIQLLKLIKKGKHAFVIEGVLEHSPNPKSTKVVQKPVIVKWYQSPKRNITYESNAYKKLEELGCPLPWFSACYRVWDSPVLVMEKLINLAPNDDEYMMGIHVINQLRFLHTFCVHCDIKPQNIMKRETDDGIEYLLIDFGGISKERLEHGYRR